MNLWQRFIRSFKVGSAAVDRYETATGHSQETFMPPAYGEYLATTAAVYAASNLRAKNLSQLPLRFWVLRNGERQEVFQGQLVELMAKVNPFWTFRRLIRMTELALCGWGQAYWVLERGQSGTQIPQEIWWVRPDRMRPVPHPTEYLSGFLYEHQGNKIPYTMGEVIWFQYDNPMDEYSGLSPIASARLGIDAGRSALRSNKAIFDQGMQMAGIVSPADANSRWPKEEVAAFQEMLARRFTNVANAHKVAVISQSAKFEAVSLAPKDAQFLELMKWGRSEVAMVYGIAPELLGDHEHATYSNVEQAEKALWTDTVVPESIFIADTITEQLLPMFGTQADLAEFDLSSVSVLQEDRTEIVDQMVKLASIGVPLNRLLQELAPALLPEGGEGYEWGKEWWAPMTLMPAGSSRPAPAEGERLLALDHLITSIRRNMPRARLALPEPEADPWAYGGVEHEAHWRKFATRTEAQEQPWVDAMREYWRRQQESVLARLRGSRSAESAEDEPFDKAVWGKRLKEAGYPLAEAVMREGFEALADEMGFGISWDVENPAVVRWLEKRTQRFAREVTETTWDALKSTLSEGISEGEGIPSLSERVRTVFTDATERRARMIARTETIAANNAGSLQAAKDSGVVTGKRWLSALDERTRDTHKPPNGAHGQVVGIDEDFKVGSGSGPAPGQIGLPEEDIQCFPSPILVIAPDIERAYRRWYAGDLIEITTAAGNQLTATPNHPILTWHGWKALGALQEGDYVVSSDGSQNLTTGHPDIQDMPAPIGEIYNLLSVMLPSQRVAGTKEQFHGDGGEGEVQVISLEGILRNGLKVAALQPTLQEQFTLADVLQALLARYSSLAEVSDRPLVPTYGSMCSRSQIPTLADRSMGHAGKHSLATVPRENTRLQQMASDNISATLESLSQCLFGCTGQIAFDQIINIQRVPFEGHVYNLQTKSGLYIGNNIITHNCRCTMTYVLKK